MCGCQRVKMRAVNSGIWAKTPGLEERSMGATEQLGATGPSFQRHRVSRGIVPRFHSYPLLIIIILQFLPPDLGKGHSEPTHLGSNHPLCSLICLEETLYLLYSFPSPTPQVFTETLLCASR